MCWSCECEKNMLCVILLAAKLAYSEIESTVFVDLVFLGHYIFTPFLTLKPFENPSRFQVLPPPPLKKSLFGGPLFRWGLLIRQIRYLLKRRTIFKNFVTMYHSQMIKVLQLISLNDNTKKLENAIAHLANLIDKQVWEIEKLIQSRKKFRPGTRSLQNQQWRARVVLEFIKCWMDFNENRPYVGSWFNFAPSLFST